jgi:hypothetical protein
MITVGRRGPKLPAALPDYRVSGGLAGGNDGKIDLGLGNLVDLVGPAVERDMQHDLDHLPVVVASRLDGADIVFANMTAFAHNFGGEAHRDVRLRAG